MDARERLRRYLEQRRELGESELVLDGMDVDDVMALLGARQSSRSARAIQAPVPAITPSEASAAPREHAITPDRVRDNAPDNVRDDVRETVSPPAPTPRFDPAAGGDWRQALGQSNAGVPPVSAEANVRAGLGAAPRQPTAGASVNQGEAAVLPAWLVSLGIPAGISRATTPSTSSSTSDDTSALSAASTLEAIAEHIRACTRCGLHATARNHVPGEGNPSAELMCVGEAPGASEDEQGRPFVGEAGQLLTKILSAIDLPREAVYICNVLKHRPPANRDPLPDEVVACQPFLERQVEVLQPRVILALGRFAAQTLLGTTHSLGKLREHVHLYRGIPVIATYHPAALLRNEAWKRPTWADVKLARRILDASRAVGGRAGDVRADLT